MISSFGYDPNQFSNYHKVTGRAGLLDYIYIHKAYVQKRFLAKAQLKEQSWKGWMSVDKSIFLDGWFSQVEVRALISLTAGSLVESTCSDANVVP